MESEATIVDSLRNGTAVRQEEEGALSAGQGNEYMANYLGFVTRGGVQQQVSNDLATAAPSERERVIRRKHARMREMHTCVDHV